MFFFFLIVLWTQFVSPIQILRQFLSINVCDSVIDSSKCKGLIAGPSYSLQEMWNTDKKLIDINCEKYFRNCCSIVFLSCNLKVTYVYAMYVSTVWTYYLLHYYQKCEMNYL